MHTTDETTPDDNVTKLEEVRKKLKDSHPPALKMLTNFLGYGDDCVPKAVTQMWEELAKLTDSWPKVCQGQLFYLDSGNNVTFIENSSQFYAYLSSLSIAALFKERKEGLVRKQEFFEAVRFLAQSYDDIAYLPHVPELARTFYKPCVFERNDTALDDLVNYFKPASQTDRELLKAAFLTPFWGGPGGYRPAFIFTGLDDDEKGGRGVGKTVLTDCIAKLAGGIVELAVSDSAEAIKKRLLTAGPERVLRFDNVKTGKLSSGDLEALITTEVISGHRLHRGEGKRPNLYTYLITFNDAHLSKDMAERAVVIRLERPQYDNSWSERLDAYVTAAKPHIIGAIIQTLEGETQTTIGPTRFGRWAREVLARVTNNPQIAAEIHSRQLGADAEATLAEDIHELICENLSHYSHDKLGMSFNVPASPGQTWFAISRKLLHQWVLEGLNMKNMTFQYAATLLRRVKIAELSHQETVFDGVRCYIFGPPTDTRPGAWVITKHYRERGGQEITWKERRK